jgi:hypothetical protein
MSGNSGGPVVTTLVCSITFAREAAGALGARHSPRPHGRRIQARPGRIAPRDRGIVCCRHCEERKRRSNPFYYAALWIASRSLSSGAHSRDPLARNDGCATFSLRHCEINLRPHPDERSAAQLRRWLARVSKDGRESMCCVHPSRRLLRKLLRMRIVLLHRLDHVGQAVTSNAAIRIVQDPS